MASKLQKLAALRAAVTDIQQSTTLLAEQLPAQTVITLRMPFQDACRLLNVVTDSVLHGKTDGDTQEYAERLMHDLDTLLQQWEG